MAWTAPRTWVAAEVPDAALMNLHVRDNLLYLVGDLAWTAPTLAGTWVNFGSGFTTAGYRRIGDMVHLKGTIKLGVVNTTAFTLPVGYRPTAQAIFAVESNNAFGVVVVNAAGTVVPTTGSNVYFQLDGIVFSTV
jgi:hypothetical protein